MRVFASFAFALAVALHAQVAPPRPESPAGPPETLRSTSSLVLVPASVRAPSGAPVHALEPSGFRLLDNGIEQKFQLDPREREPLAIVVVLQTGGAAREQLPNYAGVATMIEAIVGSSPHRVALVTFDSQPEEEWSFTTRIDALADAFQHPVPGDDGAAILPAVSHGISMLSGQPPGVRRILLLISQQHDGTRGEDLKTAVRNLCEENITIYTVTFSPQKAWLRDQFTKPRQGQPPYQLGPLGPTVLYTFDLGTPLSMALGALQTNTAAEIARLSGGESLTFSNRRDLEQQLAAVANDVPNRYVLSFQPQLPRAGFHTLEVQLPRQPELEITSRKGYWADPQ